MESILHFPGQLQPDKGLPRVAKIADDFSNRLWQPPDQRGNRDDLIVPRRLGFLHQIDYFDAIFSRQMELAKILEIGECRERLGSLARDVKTQIIMAAVF